MNKNNKSLIENKGLHKRSRHNQSYQFDQLVTANPFLKPFVIVNKSGLASIDFSNQEAIIQLNVALMKHHYNLKYWKIPDNALCPAIPGRAEYIHYLADLFAESSGSSKPPMSNKVKVLDIGTGSSAVYPLIGHQQYRWTFLASEINKNSYQSAKDILTKNQITKNQIEVIQQKNPKAILEGILDPDQQIDGLICNPPFHSSKTELQEHNTRKWRKLGAGNKRLLNFGGTSNELWYPGGERAFISLIINESKKYSKNCLWFTSLVSKKLNIPYLMKQLEAKDAYEAKEIELELGNKKSRILAWTYLNEKQRKAWSGFRW